MKKLYGNWTWKRTREEAIKREREAVSSRRGSEYEEEIGNWRLEIGD